MDESVNTSGGADIAADPAPLTPPPYSDPVTDDELATQQAAGGAPGTEDARSAPDSARLIFTDIEKAKIRANIRWIMAELDYARSGRRHEERTRLNP
jgi:hypothetical protein